MNIEQLTTRLIDCEKISTVTHESVKSAHKRLDENDRLTQGIHDIATNVETLALQIKYLTESLDSNVARLDSAVKDLSARLESGFKEQGERIGKLEAEPGNRWKTVTGQIVSLAVAAVFGVLAGKFLG